jgi:hypothetical protein
VIVTAYKPLKTQGPSTAWTQQWTLLRETNKNPDPIKSFCEDLATELKKWTGKGYEIILMIDANEEVGLRPGGLNSVISSVGLCDLLDDRHKATSYPNTYARGTKRIDYIFGTERIRQHCVSSGILPFGYGYPSDHRAIFIRCNIEKVLCTEIHPLESQATRLIMDATPKEREKFITELDWHYTAQNLYERLQRLWNIPPSGWNKHHEDEYNKCDSQHIMGMLAAERKTCKQKTTAWSPAYSIAIENKAFWKIALSLRRTYLRPHEKFLAWARARNIEDYQAILTNTIIKELRTAQLQLREIKQKAASLREAHLRELLNITQESGNDRTHEHHLKILICAHKRQNAYHRIQQILKPQVKGGLSYVLVPENFQPENYPYDPANTQTWSMVHEPEKVQKYINLRNITHFAQAHGSPFTIAPLDKIKWAADDPVSEALLQGTVPESIRSEDEYVNNVLNAIAKMETLPEIDTYISSEDVASGFRKWRESTSTSPSGCHLGLRRIPTSSCGNEEMDKLRKNILELQTLIINIPLQIGFSPARWQTIVNAMLEKIPGTPMLHKLLTS